MRKANRRNSINWKQRNISSDKFRNITPAKYVFERNMYNSDQGPYLIIWTTKNTYYKILSSSSDEIFSLPNSRVFPTNFLFFNRKVNFSIVNCQSEYYYKYQSFSIIQHSFIRYYSALFNIILKILEQKHELCVFHFWVEAK